MEGILTLNNKEQKRLIILNRIEKKELRVGGAGRVLGISERQVWRLLAAYRKEGAAGLAHGNRSRKPVNTLSQELREKVIALAQNKYDGFNHSHLTEKLTEEEETHLSRSSVRRILLEKGFRSPRKHRARIHRRRRERYPREGMLLQTDGSPHDWLEGRGPELCLIGAVDDATSKVPYALFCEKETTAGYMRMLQEIVTREGIPAALYHDHHGIFEINRTVLSMEEQLTGRQPKSQFGRLLDELGIESIAANSPQAKGRIERLWGTFQDRLSSELRLAGVNTLEEANLVLLRFLPVYNRRFAINALEPDIAYLKPDSDFRPEEYFCFKEERTVGRDNVVRFENRRLQILPAQEKGSYALCKVRVHKGLDGDIAIYFGGKALATQPAPPEAPLVRKMEITKPIRITPPIHAKPSPNHPWRRSYKTFFD
jgi:transposase